MLAVKAGDVCAVQPFPTGSSRSGCCIPPVQPSLASEPKPRGATPSHGTFAAYSANQSDFRKRATSRNTPTRTYLLLKIQPVERCI